MAPTPLRIVFFGTPAFAVPTLDALIASRHQVVGVVTQPDRPRGRGQKVTGSPVKARAVGASLPVLQPARMKDDAFIATLRALHADLGVVAAYGKILTETVLGIPRLGMINVHASLLPRYRGAAPVHRAIIAGERETGITIMRVVPALDAGPMMASARRLIGPDETSDVVEQDLAHLGARLLVTTLEALAEGSVVETPQNEAEATYAHRLTKDEGRIDWTRPAAKLHDLVRGLHPWPLAQTTLHGQRLIIRRTTPIAGAEPAPPRDAMLAPPGTMVSASADDLIVATGEGLLRILELQTEGKRPLSARAFLAGRRPAAGERFGS